MLGSGCSRTAMGAHGGPHMLGIKATGPGSRRFTFSPGLRGCWNGLRMGSHMRQRAPTLVHIGAMVLRSRRWSSQRVCPDCLATRDPVCKEPFQCEDFSLCYLEVYDAAWESTVMSQLGPPFACGGTAHASCSFTLINALMWLR